MTINPLQEQLVSLKDAAKLFPKNARGKHPHVSAIYRYTSHGCRGVALESMQAGSVRSTSREAVARFFERLSSVLCTSRAVTTEQSHAIVDERQRMLKSSVQEAR